MLRLLRVVVKTREQEISRLHSKLRNHLEGCHCCHGVISQAPALGLPLLLFTIAGRRLDRLLRSLSINS